MTLVEEEYERKKFNILSVKSKCFVRSKKDCICQERCAACKGEKCCKHFPCTFAPEEFLNLTKKAYLRKLLETRLIIIAPIYKDVLAIRARGTKDPFTMAATDAVFDDNPCALLTENGCALDYIFRPTEGLLVIPGEEACHGLYEAQEKVKDWRAYKDYMNKFAKRYGDRYLGYGPITDEEIERYKRLLLQLK